MNITEHYCLAGTFLFKGSLYFDPNAKRRNKKISPQDSTICCLLEAENAKKNCFRLHGNELFFGRKQTN